MTASSQAPRPFPWRSLEAITRPEAAAAHALRRYAASLVRPGSLAQSLGVLVSAEIDVSMGQTRPLAKARPLEDGLGVLVGGAHAAANAAGALVEAEGALAQNLVARALKRATAILTHEGAASSPDIAGAFAAVVLAAARRAHCGNAVRVLAAGPAAALEAQLAQVDQELWAASLTVLVSHDAFAARVIFPRGVAPASTHPTWDARALADLGSLPLAVPVVACVTSATATELALLSVGDALIPRPGGRWPLVRQEDGRLEGPVVLAAPSSDWGLSGTLGEGDRLVLGGRRQSIFSTEDLMSSSGRDALVSAIGDVPVVVRVEVGEAVMAARDWASLSSGDVVALGKRVGESVLLRVGGVLMARGELVDLEGEVGVRILERFLGDESAP